MSKSNISNFRTLYGNGTVYVSHNDNIYHFEEYNFEVESLRNVVCGEGYLMDEVIVSLAGDVTRKQAIKELKKIIERMKEDRAKSRRYR